jgi:hypothetical protein
MPNTDTTHLFIRNKKTYKTQKNNGKKIAIQVHEE